MNAHSWIELAVFVAVLALLTKPLGLHLHRVLDANGKTCLDILLRPLERLTYRVLRIDPAQEHDWKQYAFALLEFSLIGCLFTYAILRLQEYLPLNPRRFPGLPPALAFNTAVSFTTNTDWQSYSGESTLSCFSQMVALTSQNFFSAAAGIAVAAALVRGIARRSAATVGNFWVDVTRITYYLLLPVSLVFAIFLVSQGVIDNFRPYTVAQTIDGAATQIIAQGPMASQVAIKLLGTNGGGYTNANAAHPFENPTPLSNFFQMLAILAISSGLTYHLGRETKNHRHGWAIWSAMLAMFLCGVLVCAWAEAKGNPIHQHLGVAATDGNMEGKEVRFGIFDSALFATVTTDASCGAVNSLHDSFTPLGGLVPLFNMQTGEVIFGGVGAGLYGMLIFVVLAVFIAGLMVGRTPEYLGKKIEAYDVKMALLAFVIVAFSILGFTACACVSRQAVSSLGNAGPHGLSEMLYAFSSGAGNNGSAFAGLNADNAWWNTMLGLDMLLGRFGMMVPLLALAGSLARKKTVPAGAGTFPVSGLTFVILLVGTVVLVGALTFLPALALGPVVEHFLMQQGSLY